jgi:uncharacterized peroxidase-related enzyme
MAEKLLSRFPVPKLEEMPKDIRDQLVAVQARTGFIPNVFVVLAHRPAELRAFMAYYQALMEKDEGLTKAEREMIVVATSAANSCPYCVIAHGAILRIRSRQPLLADQLTVNYRLADISPRQRLMLDFALKVSQAAKALEEADFARLREAGFGEDEIWDIGAIAALFALSNRMAALTAMWPNEEFYTLGRVAPEGKEERAKPKGGRASAKGTKDTKGKKKGKVERVSG